MENDEQILENKNISLSKLQGVHFNFCHFKLEYIFKFPAKNIDQPLIRKLCVCHFIYNKN